MAHTIVASTISGRLRIDASIRMRRALAMSRSSYRNLMKTSPTDSAGYANLVSVSTSRRPVGFLPAAGRGVRFGSSGYAKELFPLLFEAGSDDKGALEPRP